MLDRIRKVKRWKRVMGLIVVPVLFFMVFRYAFAEGEDKSDGALPGMTRWNIATSKAIPSSPELLLRGKILYGARCSTCHGWNGDGNGPATAYLETPPRNFTNLMFKFRTTTNFPSDMDFYRTISVGFPAYGMPSFRYLSEKDKWAVVHYLKKLAREGYIDNLRKDEGSDFDPKEAQDMANEWMEPGDLVSLSKETPVNDASLLNGKKIYNVECIKCHGATGRGDGESSSTLKDDWDRPIKARDFSMSSVYRKAGWETEDMARILKVGINGTPMPDFNKYKDSELWDIAHYVDKLIADSKKK